MTTTAQGLDLMPPFQTNRLNATPVYILLRKRPSLFGVPFVLLIVGASFGMQQFTQTRYDLQDQKVRNVSLYITFVMDDVMLSRTWV